MKCLSRKLFSSSTPGILYPGFHWIPTFVLHSPVFRRPCFPRFTISSWNSLRNPFVSNFISPVSPCMRSWWQFQGFFPKTRHYTGTSSGCSYETYIRFRRRFIRTNASLRGSLLLHYWTKEAREPLRQELHVENTKLLILDGHDVAEMDSQ